MTKILILAGLALAGCAQKIKVMDVSMVSMTHYYLAPGGSLKEIGDVTGKFCIDQWNDKGSIGLFDEVIKCAQKQSGADFISNASFFAEGQCMSIEGTGEKIAAAGSVTPNKSTAPAKTGKAPKF